MKIKKKIIALIISIIMVIVILCGCGNKVLFDTTYTFRYAIISAPNGEIIEGRVESWKDYDGEQLQITIDGNTYLVSSFNVILMTNEPK